MKILVIGSGAREHTIVWKCIQSELVDRIYCTPGNPGIGMIAQCIDIKVDDFDGLIAFATEKYIDLTIVGPEIPLVEGIVDRFEEVGLKILGPSKKAALLEGSKLYAKSLMKKYGIPAADYAAFTDVDPEVVAWMAKEHIEKRDVPCVIKVDGLASGKGVVVARTMKEAFAGVDNLAHIPAGRTLLVEDMLEGWECSFIVLTDGHHLVSFPASQDYKRAYDGNKGPNTGGMGAYAPVPALNDELHAQILDTIIYPTLEAMEREESLYKGFLYAGLMITSEGPKVLEFNCRLGDPEAQVILPQLKSDFVEMCLAAVNGKLGKLESQWSNEVMVNVVVASCGYPDSPETGHEIYGLEEAVEEGALVFHAGTREKTRINPRENPRESFVTDGGRVLSVVGCGKDHEAAREMAYRAASQIFFGNKDPKKGKQWYRKDIALNIQ